MATKVHESFVQDVRIQTYAESAILTAIQNVKAAVNRKHIQADLRFLHVYAKPEGRWVVVRQATYVTSPKCTEASMRGPGKLSLWGLISPRAK